MLENWYFCSSLGLPPQAGAAHLDTIAALQEPSGAERSAELVCAAVDRLIHAETPMAVQALGHVLAAHRRFPGDREVAERVNAFYRDIAAVAPDRSRTQIRDLLRAAGSGATERAVELLGEALAAAEGADRVADGSVPPYHDLLDQLAPTVLVTVTRFLAAAAPDRVRDHTDDSPALLQHALSGRYGRLALLQAAELAAALRPETAPEVVRGLAVASGGAFDLEPDLLATAARVTFAPTAGAPVAAAPGEGTGEPDGDDVATAAAAVPDAAEDLLDLLEAEAMAGTRLLGWLDDWRKQGLWPDASEAAARRQLAYGRLGGAGPHDRSAMPSVLWHHVLLSLAAELHPGRTAARLARSWQPPDALPRTQVQNRPCRVTVPHGDGYARALLHVGRLYRLRATPGVPRTPVLMLEDGPLSATDPKAAAQVWSPWMYHGAPDPKARTARSDSEAEQLVRLLGAAAIAARLLAAGTAGEQPDHLLLLVLHLQDILGNRYRAQLESVGDGGTPLPGAAGQLAALMLHGHGVADRVGKGLRPTVHPGELVRVVARLHAAPAGERRSDALRQLAKYRVGLRVALRWLQESAAGGTEAHRTEAGGRWFAGDEAPADELLRLAADLDGESFKATAQTAALLRREIYPEERTEPLRWDWGPGGPEFTDERHAGTVLSFNTLLLSGPGDPTRDAHSVEEWAAMTDQLETAVQDTYGIVPVTLRTLRLAALLQRPELGDEQAYEEWVTSWTDLVESLNSPSHLPRWVRGRMFELFGSPVAGQGSQERLLTVLEHAVDAVIDLSAGAQFYYDRLFGRLSAETSLPVGIANRLRLRTLRALYHRWGHGALAGPPGNPFAVYGDRVSARGTEAALVQFLLATAPERMEAQGVQLGRSMARLWQRTHQPPRLPAVREDTAARSVDRRLVVAATADARTDETVLYAQNVRIPMQVAHKRSPVIDLFAAGTPVPEKEAWIAGIVCGADSFGAKPKLWLNCGFQYPISVDLGTQKRYPRPVGQLVAVRWTPGQRKGHEVAPLAFRPPRDGEVRSATLSTVDAFPWLDLSVTGVADKGLYPAGDTPQDVAARRRWDPDLSRAFSAAAPGRPLNTLAVWHEEHRNWVPLDAGLPELAVAADVPDEDRETGLTALRLVLSGPAVDRSGHGPAWRFVTEPGRSYVLGAAAWLGDDWLLLDEACSGAATGLVVHAEIVRKKGRLRLRRGPDGQPLLDRRNADWLAVFDRPAAAEPDEDGAPGAAAEAEDDGALEQTVYQEARRSAGPTGAAVWTIDVPPVEGFPSTVTAVLDQRPRHGRPVVLCSIDNWGEPQARRASVGVQPVDEVGIQDTAASPEAYARLAQLPRDAAVRLDYLLTRNAGRGDNLARLSSGLVGFAATDSLTLTGEFPTKVHRWAVVTSDSCAAAPPSRRRAQVPVAELRPAAGGAGGPDVPVPEPATGLKGLVVRQVRQSGNTVTHLRIWLSHRGTVLEALVPATAFDVEAPSPGDHLVVDRTAQGWVFSVLRRRLRLRALWECREAGAGTKDRRSLGQVDGGTGSAAELYEDKPSDRPVGVAFGPSAGDPGTGGRAKVRQDGWHGRSMPRVVLQTADAHLVGTATGVAPGAVFENVHLEQTLLRVLDRTEEVRRAGGPTGVRYVDVEREFVLSPATPSRFRAQQPAAVVDPRVAWEGFLAGPDRTLVGARVQGRMSLGALRAPDAAGVYRPWLALPDDEPETLVGGRRYADGRARAVPVPYGSGYRASHVQAPPVSTADFLDEVAPQAPLDGTRWRLDKARRPYYVGAEDGEHGVVHRFEWGYGWFTDIPDGALTVGGSPVDPRGLALFHGDRIDAMAFGRDEAGALTVAIALADVTKGVEYQIDQEAAEGGVVHLLDVAVDHARQHVAVLRVHTRSRSLTPDREDQHVEGRSVAARLDPADIAALLAACGPDTREQRVLGRLRPEPDARRRGRVRHFSLVPPRPAVGEDDPGLREGDSLYLEAGHIIETANDYLLTFALPALPGRPWAVEEIGPLEVTVSRREFSHRESCLRRAAETQGLGAYAGDAKMLVRLFRRKAGQDNRWNGSTKSPRPARPLSMLRSYLAGRGGSCFGVVDPPGRHIEVRPGVVFPVAGTRMDQGIAPGSVVRLELTGQDGIAVRQAIPADHTYLVDRPRPVVVFPKDDLKTQEDLQRADGPGRFTLAGLPGVNATARRGLGAVLLGTGHPKVAAAVRSERAGQVHAELLPLDGAEAGTLAFDPDDVVGGVRRTRVAPAGTEPSSPDAAVPWAQLSFMDDTAAGIAAACRDRAWRYHDTRTRQWVRGRARPVLRQLPARATSLAEPVFFSRNPAGWTLRHERELLQRFGFPAAELLEEPGADLAAGRRRAWAVARADRRGIWLELAPGRVAEVRSELVQFVDGHSLADLDWSLFGPGDLVYGRIEGGVSECGHLVLDDWRPGLRGALAGGGARRVLLPVAMADVQRGALLLGEGRGVFPYPADQAVLDAHPVGGAVWLDRANTLQPLADRPPAAGDVVLLAAADAPDGLRVLGLPKARVELAPDDTAGLWPGAGWLRTELAAAARGRDAFLRRLGTVPVTVERVVDGAAPVLTVSRRTQPRSIWPKGAVLARPVADLGKGYVAVQSGSGLFKLHIRQIVPGLPMHLASAAAAAFTADGGYLRLYWDAQAKVLSCGRPGSDLVAGAETGETAVRAWLPVNEPSGAALGVICRDERSQRLYWLAAAEASWTGGLRGTVLADQLRGVRRLTVLRHGAGTVTLCGLPLVEREFQNLQPGRMLRVRVVEQPGEQPEEQPRGGPADRDGGCLVSVEPLGMLARYTPADGAPLPPVGESLVAEVGKADRVNGRSLRLFEPGSRLTVTDLPGWMCESLARLCVQDFTAAPQPVPGLVPERFAAYTAAYHEGAAGLASAGTESEACAVIRASGMLVSAEARREEVERAAVGAVLAWLCTAEGRAAVLQKGSEVDLAPLLAACTVGAELTAARSRYRVPLPPGWSVFLLSRIGDRAVGSLHTEALAREWLTRPELHVQPGLWRRLRAVEIAPKLTARQLKSVLDFGEAMTGRPAEPGAEHAVVPVARGLLAAVGRLPAADALHQDASVLRQLAEIAASVRPAEGAALSLQQLLDVQTRLLRKAARPVFRDALPLTLLPAYERLSEPGRSFGRELLRAAGSRSRQT
ncbi:hypothetical protein [Kitasatospora sp. NPDC059571]|uniref:hypothetical protein n=1 Tax=Kitasatospora sp. NPDC059571 TaxID=3346871 RepID=UPI0036804CF6